MKLKNKICLITGAASGIGKSIAEEFHAQGANVILTDINFDKCQEIVQKLSNNAFGLKLDVSKEEDWENIYKFVKEKFGYLNVIVNNAGIATDHKKQNPEECSLNTWNHIHNINLNSVFLGCQYGIKLIKNHEGSIINMASRSGMVAVPEAIAYASSKAAIINLTKSVAIYCADKKYNIRCNSISPGAILTPIWEDLFHKKKEYTHTLTEYSKQIPLGHFGEAKDVAKMALYLASNDAKYVTGANFMIDGGITACSAATPRDESTN